MSDSKQSASVRSTNVAKQERSLLTRKQLIRSARKIFVRDGFENARLEEIAAAAGKTRGAFYNHFQDKEDIFFAIFEKDLIENQARLRKRLNRSQDREMRIVALASQIVEIVEDKERSMLALEYKMYVLRHSRRDKRITDVHAIFVRGESSEIQALFPELLTDSTSDRSRRQIAQIGAIIDGLSINRFFDPSSLDSATILKQATAGLRAIL